MSAIFVISDEEEETPLQTAKVRGSNGYQNIYEDGASVHKKDRMYLDILEVEINNKQRKMKEQESERSDEDVTYVPDDNEEEQFLLSPIRCMSHDIIFGADLGPSPKEFPYEKMEKIEELLVKRLKNISFASETTVWEFVLNELRCIRFAYDRIKDIDLKTDAKFNLILIRILGQYVNFRARKTAVNKHLKSSQINEICKEVWMQIVGLVGSSFVHVVMVILRTEVQNYPLDVLLYPLCKMIHARLLRETPDNFPRIIIIIVAVLFYKNWLLMCTKSIDRKRHRNLAKNSLEMNFPEKIGQLNGDFECWKRVDDRIRQAIEKITQRNAREWFGCMWDVSPAIDNFFREYSDFLKKKENASLVQTMISKGNTITTRPPVLNQMVPPQRMQRAQRGRRQQQTEQPSKHQQLKHQNQRVITRPNSSLVNARSSRYNRNSKTKKTNLSTIGSQNSSEICKIAIDDDDDDDVIMIIGSPKSDEVTVHNIDENVTSNARRLQSNSICEKAGDEITVDITEIDDSDEITNGADVQKQSNINSSADDIVMLPPDTTKHENTVHTIPIDIVRLETKSTEDSESSVLVDDISLKNLSLNVDTLPKSPEPEAIKIICSENSNTNQLHSQSESITTENVVESQIQDITESVEIECVDISETDQVSLPTISDIPRRDSDEPISMLVEQNEFKIDDKNNDDSNAVSSIESPNKSDPIPSVIVCDDEYQSEIDIEINNASKSTNIINHLTEIEASNETVIKISNEAPELSENKNIIDSSSEKETFNSETITTVGPLTIEESVGPSMDVDKVNTIAPIVTPVSPQALEEPSVNSISENTEISDGLKSIETSIEHETEVEVDEPSSEKLSNIPTVDCSDMNSNDSESVCNLVIDESNSNLEALAKSPAIIEESVASESLAESPAIAENTVFELQDKLTTIAEEYSASESLVIVENNSNLESPAESSAIIEESVASESLAKSPAIAAETTTFETLTKSPAIDDENSNSETQSKSPAIVEENSVSESLEIIEENSDSETQVKSSATIEENIVFKSFAKLPEITEENSKTKDISKMNGAGILKNKTFAKLRTTRFNSLIEFPPNDEKNEQYDKFLEGLYCDPLKNRNASKLRTYSNRRLNGNRSNIQVRRLTISTTVHKILDDALPIFEANKWKSIDASNTHCNQSKPKEPIQSDIQIDSNLTDQILDSKGHSNKCDNTVIDLPTSPYSQTNKSADIDDTTLLKSCDELENRSKITLDNSMLFDDYPIQTDSEEKSDIDSEKDAIEMSIESQEEILTVDSNEKLQIVEDKDDKCSELVEEIIIDQPKESIELDEATEILEDAIREKNDMEIEVEHVDTRSSSAEEISTTKKIIDQPSINFEEKNEIENEISISEVDTEMTKIQENVPEISVTCREIEENTINTTSSVEPILNDKSENILSINDQNKIESFEVKPSNADIQHECDAKIDHVSEEDRSICEEELSKQQPIQEDSVKSASEPDETEKVEPEKVETENHETEKMETESHGAEKVEIEKVQFETEKIETEIDEAKTVEIVESKQDETEKVEIETENVEIETEKVEIENEIVEPEKDETEKVDTEVYEARKVETEAEKVEIETEIVESEKDEIEKVETEIDETEKMESESDETEKVEIETEKVEIETEIVESKKDDTEKVETKIDETEKMESESDESEKVEIETERIVTEIDEAKTLGTEVDETEEIVSQIDEAEKVEIETEKIEIDTEIVEPEKDETEKVETEIDEARKVETEAEKVEIETEKVEIVTEIVESEKDETEKVETEIDETEKMESESDETEKVEIETEKVETETEKVEIETEKVEIETEKVEIETEKVESETEEIVTEICEAKKLETEIDETEEIAIGIDEAEKVEIENDKTEIVESEKDETEKVQTKNDETLENGIEISEQDIVSKIEEDTALSVHEVIEESCTDTVNLLPLDKALQESEKTGTKDEMVTDSEVVTDDLQTKITDQNTSSIHPGVIITSHLDRESNNKFVIVEQNVESSIAETREADHQAQSEIESVGSNIPIDYTVKSSAIEPRIEEFDENVQEKVEKTQNNIVAECVTESFNNTVHIESSDAPQAIPENVHCFDVEQLQRSIPVSTIVSIPLLIPRISSPANQNDSNERKHEIEKNISFSISNSQLIPLDYSTNLESDGNKNANPPSLSVLVDTAINTAHETEKFMDSVIKSTGDSIKFVPQSPLGGPIDLSYTPTKRNDEQQNTETKNFKAMGSGRRRKPTKIVKNYNLDVLAEVASRVCLTTIALKSIEPYEEPTPSYSTSIGSASEFLTNVDIKNKIDTESVHISNEVESKENAEFNEKLRNDESRKRSHKIDKHADTMSVRKSTRINPSRHAKEIAETNIISSKRRRKGHSNEIIDQKKMDKMIEKSKSTICRALDTIEEISPCKTQPVDSPRQIESSEPQYVQKPVDREALKDSFLKSRKDKKLANQQSKKQADDRKEKRRSHQEKSRNLPAVEENQSNQSIGSSNDDELMSALELKPKKRPKFNEDGPIVSKRMKRESSKHRSPLVMKKTYECICQNDRDKMIKRMKEYNEKIPPIGDGEDVIGLIKPSIPIEYMETRTTLIKIKKIFFHRFVDLMDQKSPNIPYLNELRDKLNSLQQIGIEENVFDDASATYNLLKLKCQECNALNMLTCENFKNFQKFLNWWSQTFQYYYNSEMHKRFSKKIYDTEESSDSNSQEKDYSILKNVSQNADKTDAEMPSIMSQFLHKTVPDHVKRIDNHEDMLIDQSSSEKSGYNSIQNTNINTISDRILMQPITIDPSTAMLSFTSQASDLDMDHMDDMDHIDHMDHMNHMNNIDQMDDMDDMDHMNHMNHLHHMDQMNRMNRMNRTNNNTQKGILANYNEESLPKYYDNFNNALRDIDSESQSFDDYHSYKIPHLPTEDISTRPTDVMSLQETLSTLDYGYSLTELNTAEYGENLQNVVANVTALQCAPPSEILPLRNANKRNDFRRNQLCDAVLTTPTSKNDQYTNVDLEITTSEIEDDIFMRMNPEEDYDDPCYKMIRFDIQNNSIRPNTFPHDANEKSPSKNEIDEHTMNSNNNNDQLLKNGRKTNHSNISSNNSDSSEFSIPQKVDNCSPIEANRMPFEEHENLLVYDENTFLARSPKTPTCDRMHGNDADMVDPDGTLMILSNPNEQIDNAQQIASKNKDFPFKQPMNVSLSRAHSSRHSSDSKSHRSKRKNMQVTGDEASSSHSSRSSHENGTSSSTGDQYPNNCYNVLQPKSQRLSKTDETESEESDSNDNIPSSTLNSPKYIVKSVHVKSKSSKSSKKHTKSGKSSSKNSVEVNSVVTQIKFKKMPPEEKSNRNSHKVYSASNKVASNESSEWAKDDDEENKAQFWSHAHRTKTLPI